MPLWASGGTDPLTLSVAQRKGERLVLRVYRQSRGRWLVAGVGLPAVLGNGLPDAVGRSALKRGGP